MAETLVETTPDGSLASAATSFEGLLATQEARTAPKPKAEKPLAEPENPPEDERTEPDKQSEAETEPAKPEETDEDEPQPTRLTADALKNYLIPVKLPGGKEVMLTAEELTKGYSRNEDYTTKTQKLAEQRREFEEREVAAVRTQREQYDKYLGELKTALTAIVPKEPDWEKMRTEVSPDQFAAELLHWKTTQDRIAAVDKEQARVQAERDADAAKGYQKYLEDQHTKLAENMPDFADPEKGATLKKELATYAKARGFTDQELNGVTDHRLVLILHDAMQFERSKSKAPVIQNRIEKSLDTVAPGSRSTTPKRNDLAAAKARLSQTGSLEDAAAAFALTIKD
jgi:hypothetical protein